MFAIPSLAELTERSRRAFRAYLPGSDAWLWPNNIGPSAKVIAGAVFEVFGFADYIAKQKFALTADSENLDLHGAEFGLPRRPSAPARGLIRITATTDITVAAGAVFRRIDGVQYRSLVDASRLGEGALDVDAIATTDGKATTANANTPLEIISGTTGGLLALANVGPDGIAGGADVEDDESYRARILFRKRYPPHGGAAADYVMWAQEVSGVSRVYVERLWSGAGTVRVFVLMDELYADGIAPPTEVERVADFIEAVRPAGAIVTLAAPNPKVVDVQIRGIAPDTVATREAATNELRAAFRRLSRVAGNDTPHGGMPFLATPTSFSRSWLWQAVANASGEERHEIVQPVADVTLTAGEIAVLGTVVFV